MEQGLAIDDLRKRVKQLELNQKGRTAFDGGFIAGYNERMRAVDEDLSEAKERINKLETQLKNYGNGAKEKKEE